MAEQNKIFPEGDLKQNRMYIENFDDFKQELGLTDVDIDGLHALKLIFDAIKGNGWSTETLKAIKDASTTVQSTVVEDLDDVKGTGWVKI